jgi:hypothetical protein
VSITRELVLENWYWSDDLAKDRVAEIKMGQAA